MASADLRASKKNTGDRETPSPGVGARAGAAFTHGFPLTVFEEGLRLLFKLYFRLVHRVRVEGLQRVPRDAGRLIVVANHASLLDGLLVWTYLKLPLKIVVDRTVAAKLLFRPFARNSHTIEIDSMNPYALREVTHLVEEGTPLLIFPEGRMTMTGSLMKLYDGTAFVALRTGAGILPLHLGTYGTLFAKKHPGRTFFSRVAVTVGRPHPPLSLDHLPRSKRKQEATRTIYRMLSEVYLEARAAPSTLGREFIRKCREHRGKPLFDDATGSRVTYGKALATAFALGRLLGDGRGTVAIMLPNLTVTALVFMSLQIFRKTAVLLNYSAGRAAIGSALELADPAVVVTSRAFLERMRIAEDLFGARQVLFVEDLKARIRALDKAWGLGRSLFPGGYQKMSPGEEQSTACILFTSGSEGAPKGVCLSHENLITNVHQALSRIDVSGQDHFFNALPLFHAFGLTVGTIIPIFLGARAFFHVSPLHYRLVPELAYSRGCTVLAGTPTFLRGYGRRANPYDFSAMRHVFSGAERLPDELFDDYAKKFGIRVLAGYGVTECSPMVSINSALEHVHGTVGMVLPGIEYKLAAVPGIDAHGGRTGKLLVRGRNVMKGYLKDEKANHKYLVEDLGWHDTGDVVEITEEGFLKIVGRLGRFAKVGGEMVSLCAVEDALADAFGGRGWAVAVIARPDERRGERLAVVTNNPGMDAKAVRQALQEKGFSDLTIPREVRFMKEMPKLGTGKVDYVTLRGMIEE
jgi:acyl-[acyl-carrier-protein]-phospholipid O-acyltransferase/long-chain-fatty-acid--[acyl-carrier-protein] ligase